jgi:histidinol phosphatase-like PHP family hydrolase
MATFSRKIPYDFHIHTVWSHCADRENTLENIIETAQWLGLKTIAFTDHYFQDPYQSWVLYENCNHVMIAEIRESLSKIDTGDLNILVGCEADCIGVGKFTIDESRAKELDLVTLSTSHFHNMKENIDQYTDQQKSKMIIDRTLPALELPWVHILPHPFWIPLHGFGTHEFFIDMIEDKIIQEMGELAIKNQIAMEINLNSLSYEDYQRPMRRVVEIWREMGVMFSRGSDAHALDTMDRDNIEDDVLVSFDLTAENFITPDWFKK